MQTPPTPPTPPSPPQPPTTIVLTPSAATQGGVIAQVGDGSALTYKQLMARAEELSRQITSAQDRRGDLIRSLRRAPPAVKDGIQAQITELNGRIVRLEQDIAANGQLRVIAKGREALSGSTSDASSSGFPMPSQDDMRPIGIVFTLFVLCPIALSFARLIWKRGTSVGRSAPVSRDSDLRMERVEQAIDTIAVEVERISEGQRFVTQLLAQQPGLGEGAAQPVRVPVGDALPAWQQR